MSATERLALLITANGSQAISELGKVGNAAKRDLGEVESRASRASRSMIAVGAGAVAAGATVASGLYSAVKAASDLGESSNKASVIFGASFGKIEKFAQSASGTIGQSERAATDAAATFGMFGKSAGLTGDGLADFSIRLTKLASDMASFGNSTPEEAVTAIGAALRGESEPIRRFGVLLDDATLRAEALKQGLTNDLSSSLTPQQRALAAYGQIVKQTTDQQGDFARTSGSLANQQRTLAASFEDFKAAAGEGALPVFQQLVDVAGAALKGFEALPDSVKSAVGEFAALASVAAIVGGGLSLAGGAAIKAGQAIKAAAAEGGGGLGGLVSNLGGLNVATAGVTAVVTAGLGIYEAWATNAERVDNEMQSLADTITSVSGAAEVLPALAQQFNSILETRGGAQDVFAKTGLGVAQVTKAIAAAPGSVDKFRDSLDGLTGGLTLLGSYTDDLGIVDAIGEIETAAAKAPAPVRGLLNELVGLYKAGGITADELRKMVDYLADLDKGAAFSATQVKANAEELWKTVPAAQQAGRAIELYKTATNKKAGEEAQAAALAELKRLFPEAAAAAGLLTDGLGQVDAAAQSTAGSLDTFKSALSAVQSVTSATDRLQKANQNLAKLGERDTKTIESAYQRIIDAKQRLDDILAGDGNNLNQESPAAQEARARARLMDANARLAANPKDAAAQTAKDEAISQIEAAQKRGQELARSAQDTARQVRDANDELASAQKDYAHAVAGPSADEISAAWKDRADAEAAQAIAIADFAQGIADGKVSVDGFTAYLDDLVSKGLISPESAEFFKSQIQFLAGAFGDLGTKVSSVANADFWKNAFPGFGTASTGQTAARGIAGDVFGAIGRILGGKDHEITTKSAKRLGVNVPSPLFYGAKGTDRDGHTWTFVAPGKWVSRYHSGGMVAGTGERDAKLLGGEYVVSRKGVKALDRINSGQAGSAGPTWNVTNHIYGQRDPQGTAVATVQKMRAKAFLKTGGGI